METLEIVMPSRVETNGLELRRRQLSALEPGQARVEMEATGVSFAEVQMRRGRYPGQPPFPFVPGYDLVGTVRAVGHPTAEHLLGRRVAAVTETGAWSDQVVCNVDDLVLVPETLAPADVVCLVVNGATAYKMLHRAAKVQSGQTIVVHGAAGGVGTVLLQLARIAGVRVIGTCRAEQFEAVRALGATPVDYRAGGVLEAVQRLIPQGVDAVFDHVGGDSLRQSFEMLKRGGVVVSYGSASTKDARGSAWLPICKNLFKGLLWSLSPGGRRVKLFDLWGRGSFGADAVFRPRRFRGELRNDLEQVFGLLARKRLRATVAGTYPLVSAGLALAAHERGGFVGKLVLLGSAA